MEIDLTKKNILVTGGSGFLGKYVVQELINQGVPKEQITVPRSKECDLRILENAQNAVKGQHIIIHLAANCGGIGYNKLKPGELFYDNLIMNTHLMEAARQAGVEKFVGLGTICSYPKFTPVPFKEENLWNGYPEETNAPYGLAKKMLLVQAQAYRQQYGFNAISLLTVNLYGPGDNFDPTSSHVIPAIIRKVKEAKKTNAATVDVWGTGTPTREFLYAADAAKGIIMAAKKYNKPEPINLGSGQEMSIESVVEKIIALYDFKGKIKWNPSGPDGQPRRALDIEKAQKEFGFKAETSFSLGLKNTIDWYDKNN